MAAPTASSDPAVQQHYVAQAVVASRLVAAMRRAWSATNPLDSSDALASYTRVVDALVKKFGQASGALAVNSYAQVRRDADVLGFAPRVPLSLPSSDLVQADVDWAMRAAEGADFMARVQARIEGATQKAVLDVGRTATVDSVAGDDRAIGFARVARANACYFCLAQAIRKTSDGRVGVYKSRATAGTEANQQFTGSGVAKFHNNCHCTIRALFETTHELDGHLADAEALYRSATVDSKRGESLNDFRRALDAQRGGRTSPPPVVPIPAPAAGGNPLADLLGRLEAAGARPAA